jgi:nucleotide-binding universal stress UspA family protein
LKTEIRKRAARHDYLEVAKEGKFDLILVGHSRLSGLLATFLGATAEIVSRYTSCCVLIVR